MTISYEGIGQTAATMKAAGSLKPGMAVTVTAGDTVGAGSDGALPCGVIVTAMDGMAAVQLSGLAKVYYDGTAPAVGWATLAGDGKGAVKAVTTGGMKLLVLSVDTTAKTAVIRL